MMTEKNKKNTQEDLKIPAKKGRPIKARIISREPQTKQFSPRGRIGRPGYKEIKFEEFEAIRMIDYMGLGQVIAAKKMHISQQTFSRILRSARKSLAKALINGEIIKVRGGAFALEKTANKKETSNSGIRCDKDVQDDINVWMRLDNDLRKKHAEIKQF